LDDGTPIFDFGFDVANFSFDQHAVIPLPPTLVLLLGALGLFGLFLRRSASAANSRTPST
jgi:hypothetical protein